MKTATLILVSIIGAAYAGVGHLSPQEEEWALQTLINPCINGQIPESGTSINGVWVYCKRAPGVQRQIHQVSKHINIPGTDQTVLVQPPAQDLLHQIRLTANVGAGRTKVYVAPSPVNNQYDVNVNANNETPAKPTVYFVGTNQPNTPSQQPPPQQPPWQGTPPPQQQPWKATTPALTYGVPKLLPSIAQYSF